MKHNRLSLSVWGLISSFCLIVNAEIPLSQKTSEDIILNRARVKQQISTGVTALQTGLPSVAARIIAQVLKELPEEDHRVEGLRLKCVTALLATGRFEEAEKVMAGQRDTDQSVWVLRRALLDLALGRSNTATAHLEAVRIEALPKNDHCWLFYLQGLLKWQSGEHDVGFEFLKKAVELAVFPAQRAQMELALYQRRILSGPVREEMVEDLKQKTEEFKGQRAGFQFVQEYALALHKLGQHANALNILEAHLALLSGVEGQDRDQLLLLIGSLSGKESGRGLLALKQLLRGGGERSPMLLGLHLLLGYWPDDVDAEQEWIIFLESILHAEAEHPLKGELLLLLAQAAFHQKQIERAREAADAYLDGFPKAEHAPDALRLLANVAISSQPPQYRTAASFLSRLQDKAVSAQERFSLGVFLADCHFLAGDFRIAADLYGTSIKEASTEIDTSLLAFQHVISLLHDGDLDDATMALDRMSTNHNGVAEYRWRAEWNLITRLKANGRIEEAFSRVRSIIKNDSRTAGVLPANLILRLRWLEAQLALEVGRPSEAAGHADNLFEALEAPSIKQLQPMELESLLAATILLKVQSLLAQKKYKESVPYLKKLREEHPETNFAQRSYLLEAAYHAQTDDLVKAQQLSLKLADDFPENLLAPIALVEAAQFAEKRGSEFFFKEALNLLERLTKQYPNHELIYYARLRQGHLFRKLNQFGNAQQIYSNLINRFPDHNEIHLALLANADCQLAQAGDDGARFEVAANLFERLFIQPGLQPSVAIEAGYKLSFVHRQRKNFSQAQDVLGSVLDRFLLNQRLAGKPLGAQGRYWMSRAILELGALLEAGDVPDEARIVYGLIEENNLPGRSLANSRINNLGI